MVTINQTINDLFGVVWGSHGAHPEKDVWVSMAVCVGQLVRAREFELSSFVVSKNVRVGLVVRAPEFEPVVSLCVGRLVRAT